MTGAVLAAGLCLFAHGAIAQESPYFVVYDHHMEEPGNLELSLTPVLAVPKEGGRSLASTLELEYGATAWWTSSLSAGISFSPRR